MWIGVENRKAVGDIEFQPDVLFGCRHQGHDNNIVNHIVQQCFLKVNFEPSYLDAREIQQVVQNLSTCWLM